MFSDITYSSVRTFSSDLQDYDLGIIGLLNGEPDDEIREIYESLPTDKKVFSMNPRAFADTTAGKNRDRAEAIAQSSYSDICYAIYKNVPSVTRTDTRLLINGIPPAKFLSDLGWF